MIYDCFIFFNELEVLDIRLHELSDVVDKFVLVESTVTHTNQPKRLYYEENKHLFKKFHKKIIHIIVRDSPFVNLAWIINDFQFSQMMRGLKKCKLDDVVLFGDLDEIPKAQKISEWKNKPGRLKVFAQKLSYYFLNCVEYAQGDWYGTRMTTYKYLLQYKTTWIAKYSKPDVVIPEGGWHFSYMGGVKKIQQKLSIMTHQEYNKERFNTPEKILQAMYAKKDILDNNYRFKTESLDKLPLYVQTHQAKFRKFLLKESIVNRYIFLNLAPFLAVKHSLRVMYRKLRKKFS